MAPASTEPGFLVKITQQIGEKVPVSQQDASLTSRYLVAAGYRSETAVTILLRHQGHTLRGLC